MAQAEMSRSMQWPSEWRISFWLNSLEFKSHHHKWIRADSKEAVLVSLHDTAAQPKSRNVQPSLGALIRGLCGDQLNKQSENNSGYSSCQGQFY